MSEESDLDKLKRNYAELKEKHGLPGFGELNRDFYVEKIAESDTDFVLREIRRFMSERVLNYLRFVETILNPVNAPMFIFSFVKSVDEEDKKKLSEIYTKLSELDLEAIKIDVNSSEEKDVNFIKKVFEMWQGMKEELYGILDRAGKNKEKKRTESSQGYFG